MSKSMYKYSRFFHCFMNDGQVCLYNSLTMETVYTTEDKFEQAKCLFEKEWRIGNNSLLRKMFHHNLIVPKQLDEEIFLKKIRKALFSND